MHEPQAALIQWFGENQRILPWRASYDPYHVWISEIMLQQTQVETVVPYFERWMTTLPDIAALGAADEHTVLSLWAGLGYYSRARNLMEAAKVVVREHGGELPADYESLRSLAVSQVDIPTDRKQPSSAIASGAKGRPGLVRSEKGLLREVIGVGGVSRQQAGVTRDIRQEYQRFPFEGLDSWGRAKGTVGEFHGVTRTHEPLK